jgi:hypothetical protein
MPQSAGNNKPQYDVDHFRELDCGASPIPFSANGKENYLASLGKSVLLRYLAVALCHQGNAGCHQVLAATAAVDNAL